jgi:hypothetical protein
MILLVCVTDRVGMICLIQSTSPDFSQGVGTAGTLAGRTDDGGAATLLRLEVDG